MKKYLLGILCIGLVAFTCASVAYGAPTEQKAQAVEELQNISSGDTAYTVDSNAVVYIGLPEQFGIVADTVNSPGEIVEKGVYYIKTVPPKGSGLNVWVAYVLAVISFIYGIFQYWQRKKTPKPMVPGKL